MEGELVRRDEAQAALEARRELGVEYEAQVVDALVERIEQRLAERRPAQPPNPAGVVIPSLALSIPLLAIAANFVGLPGVIAVCVALAVIAIVSSRG